MLIGGHFYKHASCGIETSWLFEPNPAIYLINLETVHRMFRVYHKDYPDYPPEGTIWHVFDTILNTSIPDCFIFEVSWFRENNRTITITEQDASILYIPDSKWKKARILCTIPHENGSWFPSDINERWLREIISKTIKQDEEIAYGEITKGNDTLCTIKEMRTVLFNSLLTNTV